MSSVIQYVDGFGDIAIPGEKGDKGDVTPEAQAAAAAATAQATAAAVSAKAAADSATDASASAKMGNSFWMTGSGAPPTSFTTADAPIVGARYRDLVSKKTWVATSVATASGKVTVEWEQTGPLPADMSATVEAQRLAKIVPGHTNPMSTGSSGVIPPAGSRFIIQAGSAAATTNAAGDFSFDWPEAFPTAILTVQLTSGDHLVHNGAIAVHNATTLTTCRGHADGSVSAPVRCDYIAIGY